MNDRSDRELVQGVLEGDPAAHALFVQRFHRLVWALVTRLLASFSCELREDAYQEVFLRLHCGLSSWSGGKLEVWAGRVAVRCLLSFREKASRFREIPLDETHNPPDHGRSPVEQAVQRERLERVGRCAERCLSELPAPKRALVELLLQGVPPSEIQRTLGVNRSTFYYWLHDVRDRFKSLLGDL
jgi:RNA polymerase sigma factor (sigma-70 family)